MQYANIIVDHKAGYAAFTYEIPAHFLAHLAIGSVVLVPLGRSFVHGVLVDFVRRIDPEVAQKLKPIKSLVYAGAFVPAYLINAVLDLHHSYHYGLSDVLFTLLPELPKRAQPDTLITVQDGKGFKVIEYVMDVAVRRDVCWNIAKRLGERDSSLLILCPSYSAAEALYRQLKQRGCRAILYPKDPTVKERRNYFSSALIKTEPTIFIGPRGAIITPLHHIGGIIVEEPWFPGHKDERTPKLWSPIAAQSLSKARGIPLYTTSSLPWPETQLLQNPRRYVIKSDSEPVRLLLHRSLDELITQFLAQYDGKGGDLAVFMRETARDVYWCRTCHKEVEGEICSTCHTQAVSWPRMTRDSVQALLRLHQPKNNVSLYLPDELLQYRSFSAALIIGFDPFLSITDFRATVYLASLIKNIASQARSVLMSTRHLDEWTQILNKGYDYFTTTEIEERKSFHLPPFATAVQLSALKRESLEAIELNRAETLQASKIRHHNEGFTRSLLLKRPGSIPSSWQKSSVIKVDILPNYIE